MDILDYTEEEVFEKKLQMERYKLAMMQSQFEYGENAELSHETLERWEKDINVQKKLVNDLQNNHFQIYLGNKRN